MRLIEETKEEAGYGTQVTEIVCSEGSARGAPGGCRQLVSFYSYAQATRSGIDRVQHAVQHALLWRAARQTFSSAARARVARCPSLVKDPLAVRAARAALARARVSHAASPNTRAFFATSARRSRSYPVGEVLRVRARVPLDKSHDDRAPPDVGAGQGPRGAGRRAHVRPSRKHSKLDDNAHTVLKLRCVRARVLPSPARILPRPARASPPTTPILTPRPTSRRRADGQKSIKELMERDFRAELAEREAKHFKKKLGDGAASAEDVDPARLAAPSADDDDGPKFVPRDLDADDSDDDDDVSDDDSDDDEDDTAALLAELERIKRERAADAARREAEEMQLRAQEKAEELATGTPS